MTDQRAQGPDDDGPLSPAEGARVIAEQRARLSAKAEVDSRVLLSAWGVAWLVGFGLMFLAAPGHDLTVEAIPRPVAGGVFGGLLMSAVILTIVHVNRRAAGVRGMSAQSGAMYGSAWAVSFTGVGATGGVLVGAGVDPELVGVVMTALSGLLVGGLYMVGGAVWHDRVQFVLGAVISLTTTVGVVVGMPWTYAVMALLGGGSMLAGAVAEDRRRRRRMAQGVA